MLTASRSLIRSLSAALLVAVSCPRHERPEAAQNPVPSSTTPETAKQAPGTAGPDRPLRTVKVGIAIPSLVHAVAWIADKKGFFQRHGLDAEVLTMGGSPATMTGLISGDVQIGLAGGDSAIKANLAGAELLVFGSMVTRHYHRLVVRDDIREPSDLKGRTIGLPVLGGPQDFLVYVLCRKWGLRYGSDVKIRNMGKDFARLVAITEGEVDAITSDEPISTLKRVGLRVLADPREWDEPAPYMMMVARRSFLDQNRGLVLDFMRALAGAQAFYLDRMDESLDVVLEMLDMDREEARTAYLEGGPSMYVVPPVPDREAMRVALDYIGTDPNFKNKVADFNLDRMLDGSLVEELAAEGVYREVLAARERSASVREKSGGR